MRKVMFCVVGVVAGKDFSCPGFGSYDDAMNYGILKGWKEVEVIKYDNSGEA